MRSSKINEELVSNCPVLEILDQLSDKWSLLVMARIIKTPARFSELKRDVKWISPKVLTQTLKKLMRFGLITKNASATAPIASQYIATQLGLSLAVIVNELRIWSVQHQVQIRVAQRNFDLENSLSQE